MDVDKKSDDNPPEFRLRRYPARVSGERGGVMEFLTIVKVKEDSKNEMKIKQNQQTEGNEKKKK
jgi:hypothetical protein